MPLSPSDREHARADAALLVRSTPRNRSRCKECGTKFFPRGCPVCEDCERAAMLDPDPTCAGCGEVPPDCVCAERAERDAELDHFQAEE